MSDYITNIDYDKLVEKSLKNVVIEALKITEKQGLPGEHHFYVAFRTDHPKVKLNDLVKSQYPEEMTIVIQHQYSNLKVNKDSFSITLSFSRIPCDMVIPFDAITYFGDPSAHFGMSFGSEIDSNTPEIEEKKQIKADVISIDAFRKKDNA